MKTVSQDQFSMTRFSLAVTELEPDSVYSLTVTANNMLGSATTHNIIFSELKYAVVACPSKLLLCELQILMLSRTSQ